MPNNELIIRGLNVHTEHEIMPNSVVTCQNGLIASITNNNSPTKSSLEFPSSWHLVPGFIDLHIHGAGGADTMDASFSALETISKSLVKEGVTGFLPATITAAPDTIKNTLKVAASYMSQQAKIPGAEVLGIHLEGPFLSKEQPGAHKLEYLIPPNIELFKTWQEASGNNIRIVPIAPELPGSIEFIKYLKQQNIVPSIGHTNATLEQANAGIAAGAKQCTHLFNCMPQLHHRSANALLALLLSDEIKAEIIADGFHLHPEIVKLTYKLKGAANSLLITDSMRAKNLADGVYDLGGQQVTVHEGHAKLASGTIAGSTLHLDLALRNMMHYTGCSFTEALRMATINPAKQINLFHRKGSIAAGKDADLVVLNERYEVQMTISRGQIVFQKK